MGKNVTKDCGFRDMAKPPVPLHAIDTGLVEAMHGELVILFRLAGMGRVELEKCYQNSFETGHLWDYNVDRVREILLDVYANRQGEAAANALRGVVGKWD